MKFSEQWLREWINPDNNTDALSKQLTMLGLEVDSAQPAAGVFTGVVVGQILECSRHPSADRLNCCRVDIGTGEPVAIVCGGVNVRDGLKVAVATVGAQLPGGLTIKPVKLRGEPSTGMICSSQELGLGDDGVAHGILELADDAPVGTDFRAYWQLDDTIIDIDLTPNRGDCTSIRGLARDLSAVTGLSVAPVDISSAKIHHKQQRQVVIKEPAACPHYAGRLICNINPEAKTPVWLQERLRRSGLRPIHPIVDIGNYVMLELGQPMHAFDADKLSGDITVRLSKADEKIELLDGQSVDLQEGTLVIADDQQPQAIAGIMGGASSAVDAQTINIFLESAYFNPEQVCLRARDYSLQTDSSYRFERGVDDQLQIAALERATALILEIAGGEVGPLTEIRTKAYPRTYPSIYLRRQRIEQLLGITIEDSEIERIIQALDIQLHEKQGGWQIDVPSHRFDLELEVDIIEELARIYGYDNLPSTVLSLPGQMQGPKEAETESSELKNLLLDRGYTEAITYSFVDPKHQQWIEPEREVIPVANPIAADMSIMRTSLWPGLLQAVQYNQHRQCSRLRLFEMGLVFIPDQKEWLQLPRLSGVLSGLLTEEQWGIKSRAVDFYDMKADIESLLAATVFAETLEWRVSEHSALHPGQAAELYSGELWLGRAGQLHPTLLRQFDLQGPVFVFELDAKRLQMSQLPYYTAVSKFPAVRRDLSLLVDNNLSICEIMASAESRCGEFLINSHVFDVYEGQGIEKGKKSVALGLTFQAVSRTLIEDEINEIIQSVVEHLQAELGASLRT